MIVEEVRMYQYKLGTADVNCLREAYHLIKQLRDKSFSEFVNEDGEWVSCEQLDITLDVIQFVLSNSSAHW